jgi:hypothetical protein
MDGLRQLVAELSKIQDQFKSRGIVFIVHSMKLIHLINQNANPPRSALVRRYNDFTLGYTTGIPFGDPALDHQLEVVRTDDDRLQFLDDGNLVAPHEFALKLPDLVTTPAESG